MTGVSDFNFVPWKVFLELCRIFLCITVLFKKFCEYIQGPGKQLSTRREFLRKILYKNIAIIAIQHGKFNLLAPLAIFPILLGEIHSSPFGKFSYTY